MKPDIKISYNANKMYHNRRHPSDYPYVYLPRMRLYV